MKLKLEDMTMIMAGNFLNLGILLVLATHEGYQIGAALVLGSWACEYLSGFFYRVTEGALSGTAYRFCAAATQASAWGCLLWSTIAFAMALHALMV